MILSGISSDEFLGISQHDFRGCFYLKCFGIFIAWFSRGNSTEDFGDFYSIILWMIPPEDFWGVLQHDFRDISPDEFFFFFFQSNFMGISPKEFLGPD